MASPLYIGINEAMAGFSLSEPADGCECGLTSHRGHQRFFASMSSIEEARTSSISTFGLGSESRQSGEQAVAVGLLLLGIEKVGHFALNLARIRGSFARSWDALPLPRQHKACP